MITRISTIFFAIALVIFMSASTASAGRNQSNEDVTNSRHNLGSGGATAWYGTTATDEVCVFCHTPHQSNMAQMHAAPLWNRDLRSATTYKLHEVMFDPSTDDDFAEVESGSIACLSCHDGVTGVDVMINAPGSGWGVGGSGADDQGWTFTLETDDYDASGDFLTNSVRNIGTNLMNDHPISVVFAGGTCDDQTADCLENTDWGFRGAVPASYGGWHVKDAQGTETEIYIYAREADEFDSSAAEDDVIGSVECGSCHNPHLPSSTDSLFLRLGSNSGSQVCLVCHIK